MAIRTYVNAYGAENGRCHALKGGMSDLVAKIQDSIGVNASRSLRRVAFVVFVLFFQGCSASGPVRTLQADSDQPVVAQPAGFRSPLEELDRVWSEVEESEDQLLMSRKDRSDRWSKYSSWLQVYDTLEADQTAVEEKLSQTGEVVLEPGRSYSFELESYCVMPGTARPLRGDGLRVARLRGPAENWILEILIQQGKKRVSQEKVQYLIWALLADVRFDELSKGEQATLLEFFPDAERRFGNRRLENLAKGWFRDLIPLPISIPIETIERYREEVLNLRERHQEIAERLAPSSNRVDAIPVGWLRMSEGYFLKATSDSYNRIRFDLYVPHGERRGLAAKPVFQPWQWVGLPEKGQRVAASVKSARKKKTLPKTACDIAREWKPKDCRNLSSDLRRIIIESADPKNFPTTRYQLPPPMETRIEEATDCSHFVHEIYRRVGFEYKYAPTQTLQCLSVFSEVTGDPKAGDLVLYPGHVGIHDGNGNIISATRGGRPPRERSMLDSSDPDFVSAVTRYPVDTFGKGRILRWKCK